METGSPPISKVVTMVLFAISCVGLLMFLWLSFGGTIPFNSEGYRVRISFPNAQELATQADVRIAGVSVGKVIAKSLDPRGNGTIATIELDRKYAPLRRDARAILRQKTLLGETYIEITPGSPRAPTVADDGLLPRGQVQPAVQLDQIFNAFDPTTRHAFQNWQQELAKAIRGNDQNLNSVLGNLPSFAADASDILRVLDIEHTSVVNLVRNGGTVFSALGQNQAALRNLITSGESVFSETAQNNNALADTFHVFPTFLNEAKATMAKLQTFSLNTDPLFKELVPVAQNLGPTLQAVQTLSPNLRRLFHDLGPTPQTIADFQTHPGDNLISVSQTGLPATARVLRGAKPLLTGLGNFLSELNPILDWLSLHQQLISDFISNGAYGIAAKTTSFGGAGLTCHGVPCGHYLRQFGPTGPETLGIYQNRPPTNRGNTYPPPLWLQGSQDFIKGNFPSWDCRNTGAPGDGSVPADNTPATGHEACWVAPPLPGAPGKYLIPRITAHHYPSS